MYVLRFDGLYQKVPGGNRAVAKAGFMCFGWLIFKNGILVAKGHGAYPPSNAASSNLAEYLALIEGLEALKDMGVRTEPVVVMGDAKSVIDQMNGSASVSARSTLAIHKKARRLVDGFTNLQWCWTPRQYNQAADRLTRRALNQLRSDLNEYQAALNLLRSQRTQRSSYRDMLPVMDFCMYQMEGVSKNL